MENPDLLEFDKLKDEQIGRLAYRDNLFYLSMGIMGGITAAYFAYDGAKMVLLWLPWAMFIVGVAHLTCERRIQDIGLYIQRHLTPAIAAQAGREPDEIFAWETFYRKSRWHPWRKRLQFASSILLYVVSGGTAVLFYFFAVRHGDWHAIKGFEKGFVIADSVVIAVTLVLFIVFARFSPDGAIPGKAPKPVRRFARFKRLLFAAVLAALAGAAVFYGAAGLMGRLAGWCAELHWPMPSLLQLTAAAAALTLFAALAGKKG